MDFKEKIEKIKEEVAKYGNAKIVVATKYMDIENTRKIVEGGLNELGENRTDMFLEKYEALKDLDIKWHFFGVVQSRKVKDVANKIDCLHSLDKLSLAMELDKRLENTLDCFVQVNISEEVNKQGIPANRVKPFIKSLSKCTKIRVIGLMCIAKMTYDEELLAKYFSKMKIDAAKRMIRSRDENVKQISRISDMLNFSTPAYFYSTFKKVTGMTPSEYATSIRHYNTDEKHTNKKTPS